MARLIHPDRQEGFVVRPASGFSLAEFSNSVAKWVRKNHVQTDEDWLSRPVVPNALRETWDVTSPIDHFEP